MERLTAVLSILFPRKTDKKVLIAKEKQTKSRNLVQRSILDLLPAIKISIAGDFETLVKVAL